MLLIISDYADDTTPQHAFTKMLLMFSISAFAADFRCFTATAAAMIPCLARCHDAADILR